MKMVALVTGGSAGLGQDIARALQRDGYQVLVCARRADRLATMATDGSRTMQVCCRRVPMSSRCAAWASLKM